jgi:DHA2 family multidrug resistance protein
MARFNAVITRQASMLSYIDDFQLMLGITILCAPMILLMRTPKKKSSGEETVHVAEH